MDLLVLFCLVVCVCHTSAALTVKIFFENQDVTNTYSSALTGLNQKKLPVYVYGGPNATRVVKFFGQAQGATPSEPITYEWSETYQQALVRPDPVFVVPLSSTNNSLLTLILKMCVSCKEYNFKIKVTQGTQTVQADVAIYVIPGTINLNHPTYTASCTLTPTCTTGSCVAFLTPLSVNCTYFMAPVPVLYRAFIVSGNTMVEVGRITSGMNAIIKIDPLPAGTFHLVIKASLTTNATYEVEYDKLSDIVIVHPVLRVESCDTTFNETIDALQNVTATSSHQIARALPILLKASHICPNWQNLWIASYRRVKPTTITSKDPDLEPMGAAVSVLFAETTQVFYGFTPQQKTEIIEIVLDFMSAVVSLFGSFNGNNGRNNVTEARLCYSTIITLASVIGSPFFAVAPTKLDCPRLEKAVSLYDRAICTCKSLDTLPGETLAAKSASSSEKYFAKCLTDSEYGGAGCSGLTGVSNGFTVSSAMWQDLIPVSNSVYGKTAEFAVTQRSKVIETCRLPIQYPRDPLQEKQSQPGNNLK